VTKHNILIFGAGYVGLSIASLLANKNNITIFDINNNKINLINDGISPIIDYEIEKFLKNNKNKIKGVSEPNKYIKEADFCIICVPTDFDEKKKSFNTDSIDKVIKLINTINKNVPIVIKSTVPIGYTKKIKEKIDSNEIIFSPEFLREGNALTDNQYPSRIIVGSDSENAREFAKILKNSSKEPNVKILLMNSSDAEATKLFSNSFLAMKVAFYNELDNLALENNLDAEKIILGMSLDHRIGNLYNNPSFGYGGYCLPKDIKQLSNHYKETPQSIINSIIESNSIRKNFIIDKIIKKNEEKIGIYLLDMKKNADNNRNSAIIDIVQGLIKHNKKIIIFDPKIKKSPFKECSLEDNFNNFVANCDLIITNRLDNKISKFKEKVFTRDIFGAD
tara:strand:- start:1459 stop:2634 length:1176 start_codon:yes stop_codon:yes gene_type:complete